MGVYAAGLVIMQFYHLDKEFDGIMKDLKDRAGRKAESNRVKAGNQ